MAEAVAPVPMDELEDEEQPVNYEQVVTDAIVASPNRPTASARIRDFLKSHLLTDADATTDEESQREAAGSPPPNCAICLGKVSSKCFTDSCMHQFCFSCLLEWSKVSLRCFFMFMFIKFHLIYGFLTHRSRPSVRCASRPSSRSSTMCGPWTSTRSTKWSRGGSRRSGRLLMNSSIFCTDTT